MPRRTKTITFSLPPEMAARVEEMKRDEGRTTNELVREALRYYFEGREQQRLVRYGDVRPDSKDHRPKTSSE